MVATSKGITSYDVDADEQFQKTMSRIAKSTLDLRFSMGEAARIVKKESTANFILKGAGKYPPLKKRYRKRKNILAPGSPILTGAKPGTVRLGKLVAGGGASEKLKKSIIETTADSVVRIGKQSLEIGTQATSDEGYPYPIVVQEGSTKRNVSARKFLFFTKKMVARILKTVEAEEQRKLNNA